MITQINDRCDFDDIKATRIHKIKDGGGSEEVSIKDLTKDELMDVARTYFIALQEIKAQLNEAFDKLK